MGFLVSPGVDVNEIDLTNVIPAVSTSIGGYAGPFRWGPVNEIKTVSSEKELAALFGEPDDLFAESFFTASSFLKYGSTLKVVRSGSTQQHNATSSGLSNLVIENEDHFLSQSFEEISGFHARYPGKLGNSLMIEVIDEGTFATSDYDGLFDAEPSSDEFHIVIIDEDGEITGTPKTALETWAFLGRTDGAQKEDGSNNYFVDVINKSSAYIYVTDNAAGTLEDPKIAASTNGMSLGNGDNEESADNSDKIVSALELFEDSETVDVNLLFAYNDADTKKVIANELARVAVSRKDVVAFISPPIETSTKGTDDDAKVTAVNKFFNGDPDDDQNNPITSTSYVVFDSTAIYTYNKYADKYLWIPACGHVAGLCANADDVAEPWFSPAGYNRGQLLGVTKLAINPNQPARDKLYKARINPIVSFPGQGTILFGDKTALAKPSAFDRINVRRLFIALEKAISTAAKYQLFELNDQFTRSMFKNMTEPFLRDVKGRRGVTDFLVVCDETNNTGEIIDANRFVADIYIKPARSINFISLNFIATRTGVEFSEIVGK